MKTLIKAVPFLFLVFLAACASSGTQLQADKLAKIKPGVTTKAEMLQWFGSPMSMSVDANGKVVVVWFYTRVQSLVFSVDIKKQMLSVLLDTNDVVEKFTLIDDVNK
jgi:outer membrane protein assembly factor BamE (lipoprotein component of BamABCDE complex)